MVEAALPEVCNKFDMLLHKIKTIGSSFSEQNPFRAC